MKNYRSFPYFQQRSDGSEIGEDIFLIYLYYIIFLDLFIKISKVYFANFCDLHRYFWKFP